MRAMAQPMLKSVRIFISYSNKDKKAVASLKESLEGLGFEVFIAHEDIKPRSEWQDEIIRNLQRCDIFVPFLSDDFGNSDWVDQETGIAIASGKLIVPLQVDIPPYGFIGKYQSLKISRTGESESDFDMDKTADRIASTISADQKFKENLKGFVVNSLLSSPNYYAANKRVARLRDFEYTGEEINRICLGVLANPQVYGAYTAQEVLKEILEKYRDVIKPEIYAEIIIALSKWDYHPPVWVRKLLEET